MGSERKVKVVEKVKVLYASLVDEELVKVGHENIGSFKKWKSFDTKERPL